MDIKIIFIQEGNLNKKLKDKKFKNLKILLTILLK